MTFAIAGYPRWKLYVDGEPLEWYEEPVWGKGMPATISTREHGELRGGKARGDDGSEPTLIAAELPAGLDDAELELRYDARGKLELFAELASLLGWLGVGLLLLRRESVDETEGSSRLRGGLRRVTGATEAGLRWLETRLVTVVHPLTVCVLIPALLGAGIARWQQSAEREGPRLTAWVEAGAARVEHAKLGPLKTDMLIRPAVILRPRPGRPAIVELEVEELPDLLRGFAGLDDDQAQQNGRWSRHELRIDVRPRDAGGAGVGWSTIAKVSVPHEPGRVKIAVETGQFAGRPVSLRIVDETRGKRLARLGINLDLGVRP